MRANKYLTISTTLCTLCSLVISICIGKASNSIIYDIMMAILGSALLGSLMSLIQYFAERRTAMEEFWNQAFNALKVLRNIKLIDIEEPIETIIQCFHEEDYNNLFQDIDPVNNSKKSDAKQNLISWIINNDDSYECCSTDALENEYQRHVQNAKECINETIRSFMEIATYNLGDLNNAYGRLDFMFANKTIRMDAYNKIYKPIMDSFNKIKQEGFHFNLLVTGERNFAVCALKAKELCDYFSDVKESSSNGAVFDNYYLAKFDDIEDNLETFRCHIYHNTKREEVQHSPVTSRFKGLKSDN